MPRTFKDTLDADASVFLNADEYGDSIEHRRGSVVETIVGVLDADDMGAENPTTASGVQEHQLARLEIAASVEVWGEQAGGRQPSTFSIDGVWWLAIRVLAKDSAMQSVLVARTDQKATRRAKQ